MRFRVLENNHRIPTEGKGIAFLWTDNWDDWFRFNTLYVLHYFDEHSVHHRLGGVKIGQFSMSQNQRRPDLLEKFTSLDERFFSLGQDVDYYEKIRKLPNNVANDLLSGLNDVVADEALYQRAKNESVMGISLMRSVNERTLSDQFRRIAAGGARLTKYAFRYRGPSQLNPQIEPIELSFAVEPNSKPPTNVQVIVGRNGVGKSFFLNAMSRALVFPEESAEENGRFFDDNVMFADKFHSPFSNVVSVTFSAFDDFPLIRTNRNALKGIQYTNVGLRSLARESDEDGSRTWNTMTQAPNDLARDFIASAKTCTLGERRERWLRALNTLESDPIFEEAAVSDLLNRDMRRFGQYAGQLFRRLSSGHKIVLLCITKLVETVEERTLVLMDEPEAHLHPPLLAGFVRALSDLLVNRNGVAIIATHSPVVLQEVPKRCVWKVRRHGGSATAERLRLETFAEHVGHLTHDVFGLEVTQSGFHRMITDAAEGEREFRSVGDKFDNEVGSEGRALISMLLAHRE